MQMAQTFLIRSKLPCFSEFGGQWHLPCSREVGHCLHDQGAGFEYVESHTFKHMAKMKRLVGYLKETKDQYMHLPYPVRGQGIQIKSGAKWLLVTFTDADWSGSRGHRHSTSAGVHAINGLIVFASSRGQKVVSLSSSESELHALVSGACDGVFIKSTMMFLVNEEVHHVCLLDNSSTRQTAQKKGSGKLRHVSGKLLWCQDRCDQGDGGCSG